jgi:hypothetical protein
VKTRFSFLLAAVSLLILPGRAAAQGGFLDWISQLSGPEIKSVGVFWDYCLTDPLAETSRFLGCGETSWLLRGAVATSFESSNLPEGASGDVDLLQFSASALRRWPLAQLELGMVFHEFSGDGFASFWRDAYVLGLAATPHLGDRVVLEIGPRLRYFADSFESQDFGGNPEPEDPGGEWVWGGMLTVRYSF